MKLNNKLDTNQFFTTDKIIRNLHMFLLYLYIVFSNFYTKYEKI